VTCEKIITFPETLIHCHFIWYSREEIKTLEFKIRSLQSNVSLFNDQIKYLQAQNKNAEDAKEEAKELRQQLDTLKRYLFVKICHMFS
jgi:septal ring factor EnvC (AmiA/AmiB activator)